MKKIEEKKQRQDSSTPQSLGQLKKIIINLSEQKLLGAYLGFVTIWAINVSTIFRSSWAGDDWPISQTPYWIRWRYGAVTNWNIWTEAMFWNDQWMEGAGRFYPLTWIESRFVFSYLTELWQYKLYQIFMLFIAGLFLTLICYLFTRSHTITLFVLASLPLTVQFRRDFDPHLAFAVMLPSLLIKIFLASIFAYLAGRSKGRFVGINFGVLSGFIFFAAMSTYEFGFLLFPLLVISFVFGSTEEHSLLKKSSPYLSWLISMKFLPIMISWISYGIFVFGYLRPRATAISGSYVLGVSWSSVEVFLSQAIMGLPLISLRTGDLSFSLFTILISLLIIFVCRRSFKIFFYSLNRRNERIDKQGSQSKHFNQNRLLLLLYSLALVLSPGFMMAMQPTWWDRADVKHTYLGVMITEFGTAMLIALLLERLLSINPNLAIKMKKNL